MMENPGECSVCFTEFEERERRPRTLPCGHTFCSLCIGNMIEGGQLSCPTCCAHHPAISVAQFAISYGMEAMVKQLKVMKLTQTAAGSHATVATAGTTSQKKVIGISRKLQSLLDEQNNNVRGMLEGREEIQCQLNMYQAHLAEWKTQHHHHLDRLYDLVEQIKAALELLELEDTKVESMKTEGKERQKELEAVLECLEGSNTTQEVVTAIDHADQCTVEAEDWKQNCLELFPDVNIITTSLKVHNVTRTALESVATEAGDGQVTRMTMETEGATVGLIKSDLHQLDPIVSIIEKLQNIRPILQGKIKVEDLHKMKPLMKKLVEAGCVFGVQEDQGGLRSSRITLENDQLYFHCLQDQCPPRHATTLPVSELVGTLDPSSTLVYLDLSWPGSTRGRVQIQLSPDTSLARQFFLLCTGLCGHSYLNTALFEVVYKGEEGEYVTGGDYEYNNGTGGASLLPHDPKVQYQMSSRAGTVCSWWWMVSNMSAQFEITTRDQGEGLEYPFVIGEVVSGLEVVKAAVNHIDDSKKVTVVDCGVVIPH